MLLGRRREARTLERLLDTVREGRGGALVLRGESGVGKTALLHHVRECASGCRVVTASAAQSEVQLPFAALHQLCVPLLDGLEGLPGPQRTALSVAFGLTEGVPADPLFLGLAVLSLLSTAAKDRPLLCLIDDVQWADRESSDFLGFVARRAPESVALVVAARDRHAEFAGVPELHLRGLTDGDARALLTSSLATPLDEQVRERILAEADGNPLAILDVCRRVTSHQLAGGFGKPDAGTVAGWADPDFAEQLASLLGATRQLLVVAAAEPTGEPLLLWRACERLAIPAGAARSAEATGLLNIATRVRFRHPSLRAVIYRLASPEERCIAHGALADATDAWSDPERRAWHRAHAASAPDERVAADLQQLSRGAAARGGVAAEAEFLRHAAALTADAAARARRALASAEAARLAGDCGGAVQVLVTAEAGPLDPLGRARADLLRARMSFSAGAADAAPRLYDAARRLEPLDTDLARQAYLDTLAAVVQLGSDERCDPVAVASSALAVQRVLPARPTDLLLDGLALQLTKGYAVAAPTLRCALEAFGRDDLSADHEFGSGWLASHLASALWQHDSQHAVAERSIRLARETGAVALLPPALVQLAITRLCQGELTAADRLVRDLEAGDGSTPSEPSRHVAMLLAAYRGLETEARRMIGEAEGHLTSEARGLGAVIVWFAGMVLNNGLGRYGDALRHGRGLLADPEPVARPLWALPELIEAGVRAGANDVAADALCRLNERAAISGTDWALGLEARSRALLSEGSAAEGLYREAIARLDRHSSRLDLARAHLLYGEWLRRAGRRIDARAQLRVAFDMLSDMGLGAFADRARRELRATGETARKRTFETRDELTAQELQVAKLANDGLSNPEIGARLFLSPRTIEWHMRKVFRKLDVSSRLALRDALPAEARISA